MPVIGTNNPGQDANQNTSVFALSGTLGPTYGTAEQIPLTADATGAVRITGNISANPSSGTLNTLGTVDVVNNIVGGTITKVAGGTIAGIGTNSAGLVDTTTFGSIVDGSAFKVKFTDGASILSASPTGIGNNASSPGIIAVGIYGQRIDTPLTFNDGRYAAFRLTEQRELMVAPSTGTQQTLGTVGTVLGIGTLTGIGALPAHAITLGTVLGPNAAAGTSTTAPIQIGGTSSTGTVYGILTDTAGHLHTDVEAGTIQSSGTTTGVGVVTNLTSGSVRMTIGTLTTGTLQNLVSGTINALAAGTITGGTIQLGTVKLDPTTIPTMLQHGTLGTAGGSFFGTISAASGAGTKHYVQGVDIVMQSGTADVRVLAGTAIQGTGVLIGGAYPAGGGISKNWSPHFATGTNSELTYHFVGAGTAFITVSYWKGA